MFSSVKEFFSKSASQFEAVSNKIKFFIKDSKRKFNNLYQTNYNNGLYHLEHGHLWDATFRFKIITKFWPHKVDPQYQYAVCLVLNDDEDGAKRLLENILKKNPNYTNAKTLLARIKNGEAKKMVAEFNSKSKPKPKPSPKKKPETNAKPKNKSSGNGSKKKK